MRDSVSSVVAATLAIAWIAATHTSTADEIAVSHDGAVWIVDLDSGDEHEIARTGYDRPLAWSPDGTQLIYWKHSEIGWDLWQTDAEASKHTNLTKVDSGGCRSATYSPDGSMIGYLHDDPGGVYLMNADGTGKRRLTVKGHRDAPPVWSPDGRYLAYTFFDRGGTPGSHMLVAIAPTADPHNSPQQVEFEQHIGAGDFPRFSTAGDALLLLRSNGVQTQIIAVPFPITPAPQRVVGTLRKRAYDAVWSPDGSAVAYWARAGGGSRYGLRIAEFAMPSEDDADDQKDDDDDQDSTIVEQLVAIVDDWHAPPAWSADGSRIALCATGVDDMTTPGDGVFVLDRESEDLRRIVEGHVLFAAWRPGGEE